MAAKPKKLRRLPLCLNKTGDTTIARGDVCVEVAGLGMRISTVRFKTRTIERQCESSEGPSYSHSSSDSH